MSEPLEPSDINRDPATENATDLHLDVHFPLYTFENVKINDTGDLINKNAGRAQYYRENLGNDVYLDMAYIPGGTFLKGSPAAEIKTSWSQGREEPQHAITLPAFWLGKYAITQEQWQAVMGSNPSRFTNPKKPV